MKERNEFSDGIQVSILHSLLEVEHAEEEELGLLELYMTEHFPGAER